jgi:hypothetical protein
MNKKFGRFLGSYNELGVEIELYQDGNQVYWVAGGEILPGRTIHVDDVPQFIEKIQKIGKTVK